MLSVLGADGQPSTVALLSCGALPPGTVWLDLLAPSREEELLVERCLGICVPTDEDMGEIEPSSRLYERDGSLYLTASLLCGVQHGAPRIAPVAFVMTSELLVTVRYSDPTPFQSFRRNVQRQPELCRSAAAALVFLLDAVVERTAEILRDTATQLDAVKVGVFRRERRAAGSRIANVELEDMMFAIGRAEETLSKVRESLASLTRLISYLIFALPRYGRDEVAHLKTVGRDVSSLTDMAAFMSGNITFLLDAALGLISIQQNAIIKIFSVAAVIFLPPTLVGTVYGMNFHHLPELSWNFGYPFALALMLVSAILPYWMFRAKGWL